MTLEEAREHANEKKELIELENRILRLRSQLGRIEEDGVVADTVKGTRKDGTIGPIKIKGFQTHKYYEKKKDLKLRIATAEHLKEKLNINVKAFEEFVYSIDNSRIRRMISMRYIDGLSWQQVSERMGKGYTSDNCRVTVSRFFEGKI